MGGYLVPRSILIYALGGGHGHVVRGASLAAALRELGLFATVVVPATKVEWAESLGARVIGISRTVEPDKLRHDVQRLLVETEASVLVVDTFAEGLLGELIPLPEGLHRVVLLRLRRDGDNPVFQQALEHYDMCIDLEPHLEWLPARAADGDVTRFGPVARAIGTGGPRLDVLLVADDTAQLRMFETMARRLDGEGRKVGLYFSGTLTTGGETYRLHPLDNSPLQARVVVGPAGFNLCYELLAQRSWHIALPRPKSHDHQGRRARALALTVSGPGALERLVEQLLSTTSVRQQMNVTVREHAQLASLLRLN